MRGKLIATGFFAGMALLAAGQEQSDPATAQKLSKEVPLVISAEERDRVNPVPRTEESVRHGMLLFSSQCAMCHGKNGAGGGSLAESLKMTVPDFTDAARSPKRTDGELFYIITRGHARMPADGERLTEQWRWDMVNAIRSMAVR